MNDNEMNDSVGTWKEEKVSGKVEKMSEKILKSNRVTETLNRYMHGLTNQALMATLASSPKEKLGDFMEALENEASTEAEGAMIEFLRDMTLESLAKAIMGGVPVLGLSVPASPAATAPVSAPAVRVDSGDEDEIEEDDEEDEDEEEDEEGSDEEDGEVGGVKKAKKAKKDKKAKKAKKATPPKPGDPVRPQPSLEMFEFSEKGILKYLKASGEKQSIATIADYYGVDPEKVKPLILSLLKKERVLRVGQARGTKYQYVKPNKKDK